MRESKINKRLIFLIVIYLIVVPSVIASGYILFKKKNYILISIIIAFLSTLPMFIKFERSKSSARELVIIAAMTALSVLGRIIFTPLPAFKPVTAMVIITGIAFGSEAGFITGALTALISNIFMGQGPWTPFQMFSWGFTGLISGFIFRNLGDKKPNTVLLIVVAILSGILFSLLMDIWTVLSYDGVIRLRRYLACLATSFQFTIIYCVSNVIFLLLLTNVILNKTKRLKNKYGIFK